MKCLYCNEEINVFTFKSLFIERDLLCYKCRKALYYHHQKFKLDNLEVESFYDYNSLFKDLLLQYKECYDEALKEIFLYDIKDYINIKYHGYKIILIPSTKKKLEERGFNHLDLIFNHLELKMEDGLKMKEELTQENKGYRERNNMINNYYYEGKSLNKALIVDDVCTSGSSLIGAYKVLSKKAKKVKAIVLAKT